MKKISDWAIKNPVPVVLLFILVTGCGLLGYKSLSIQNFPDMDLPVIFVTANLDGAAPAQLETEVARTLEDQLATLNKLDHINTTITDGAVNIAVIFEIEKNPETALDEVRNAVESVRSDLPSETSSISVSHQTVQEDVLVSYAIQSDRLTEDELSWLVDNDFTKCVLSVKGVGEAKRAGGIDREVHVDLDPGQIASLGLTATGISSRLRSMKADFSGGRGEIGGFSQGLRTLGAAETLEDIKNLILPTPGGGIVRLDSVAWIEDSYAERSTLAYLDGERVISLQIKRSNGYSDTDVYDGLEKAVASFRIKHPETVVKEAYTTVKLTRENFDISMHMLYEGALITLLVVWLFLRRWRETVISAVALPLSVIPAFMVMAFFGFSLNVISLLALSLVVGILVDDAIVEVENISRHLRMGKTPFNAAMDAAGEIGLAVVATSLTLVAVFLPTAFMGGIFGMIFRQFGITASAAVLASLLVARLLTPMMAAYWMKPEPHKEKKDSFLLQSYMTLTSWCLSHRKTTVTAVFVFLVSSVLIASVIGTSFVPASDSALTRVKLTLPPGSPLEKTGTLARTAAARVSKIPEVKSVFVIAGEAGGGGHPGESAPETASLNSASLNVVLVPISERKRKQGDVEKEICRTLNHLPGVRVQVGEGEDGNTLDITLVGSDPRQLDETVLSLESQLRTIKGVGHVIPGVSLESSEIQIRPDYVQAAAFGVTSEDMAEIVRVATRGDYSQNLAKLNLPERQIPINVRLSPEIRKNIDQISRLQIPCSSGTVNLGSVAEIHMGGGAGTITHIDRNRNITVSVELNGRNIGDVMKEAMDLPLLKHLPSGITQLEQGEMQQITEMFESFGIAMLIGVFCVYSVLVLLFRDFFQPVTILMAMPLALGGAFFPLVVTGSSFSMAVVIGLLMLMGITTKNSILLVEYAIMAREKGMSRIDALMDACHKRARPILMTTIAMIGGMLPVVVGISGGDPSFRSPMGIVVAGGLVSSTFLSLVVIPVVYTLIDDLEVVFRRLLKLGGAAVNIKVYSMILLLMFMNIWGCTLGPDHARPSVDVPTSWNNNPVCFVKLQPDWWKCFNDPVLDHLVDQALLKNLGLASAMDAIDESTALLTQARAAQLPGIDLKADAARADSVGIAGKSGNTFGLSMNLSFEIDFWGKYRRAREAEKAALLATRAAYHTVRTAVIGQVLKTYFSMISLDRKLTTLNDKLSVLDNAYRLKILRYHSGETEETDTSTARADIQSVRSSIKTFEIQRALVTHALGVLIGNSPRVLISKPVATSVGHGDIIAPDLIPVGLPSDLLNRRPDIIEAEEKLHEATADIGVAKAAFFPSVSITGLLGFASDDFNRLATLSNREWSGGISLLQPLFEGGKLKSQLDAANARQRNAYHCYQKTVQNAFREVLDTLVAENKTRTNVEDLELKASILKHREDVVEIQFKNGQESLITLMDLMEETLDAQIELIDARLDYLQAMTDLCCALGGGWKSETENMLGFDSQAKK